MKFLYKENRINIILNNKGNIFKLIKNVKKKTQFDELYISEIKPYKIKGWKFHSKKIQRIYVPIGKIQIFIFNSIKKKIKTIKIGEKNRKLITIYNGVYYGFKSISKEKSLILNLTYFSKKNKPKTKISYHPVISDIS
tara:strand:+ start:20447 stop:20860 length:414 start_codon:yes stop_codon:yes gene_type:complete